jgi:hypothetical protein
MGWGPTVKAALQAGSDAPRTSKEVRVAMKSSMLRAKQRTAERVAKVRANPEPSTLNPQP